MSEQNYFDVFWSKLILFIEINVAEILAPDSFRQWKQSPIQFRHNWQKTRKLIDEAVVVTATAYGI
jgi:hypothetical protein